MLLSLSSQSSPSTHNQRNLVSNSIFSPELLADADDDLDSADLLAFAGPIPSTPITNATYTSISTSNITKTNSNKRSNISVAVADDEVTGLLCTHDVLLYFGCISVQSI